MRRPSITATSISRRLKNRAPCEIRYHPPGGNAGPAADRGRGRQQQVRFDEGLMRDCPDLRLIAVTATGYNNIDIDAASRLGIAVANVAGYSSSSVRAVHPGVHARACHASCRLRRGPHATAGWSRSEIYTMGTWPTFELEGKVLGIMGWAQSGARSPGRPRVRNAHHRARSGRGRV